VTTAPPKVPACRPPLRGQPLSVWVAEPYFASATHHLRGRPLKRRRRCRPAGRDGEVVVDGRPIGLSEEDAERAFRRACGQPGSRVARMVHVILGDGRLVTYVRES
jgi:hypothetical protein